MAIKLIKIKNINKLPQTIAVDYQLSLILFSPGEVKEVHEDIAHDLMEYEKRSPGHWTRIEEGGTSKLTVA